MYYLIARVQCIVVSTMHARIRRRVHLTCAICERLIPQSIHTAVGLIAVTAAELVASVALVDRRGAAGVAVPRDQDAVSELWRQRAVDVCN